GLTSAVSLAAAHEGPVEVGEAPAQQLPTAEAPKNMRATDDAIPSELASAPGDEPAAQTDGVPVAADEPAAQTDGVPVAADEPYGPGSATPAPDGSGPAGWLIKGNANSMLFHTQESPSYQKTRAEVWFRDEDSARAAGFAHWDRTRR